MTAMGWKEGEGLGATKQGIKEHIRVKKNFENWGVGAVTSAERARDWSNGMAEFHRVLSTLSEITSQHARGKGDDDAGTATTTENEQSDASDGDLRKARRKKNKDTKKKKKDEKKKEKKKRKGNSSGSDSQDSKDEEEEEAPPAHKRVKLATHLGRFKKRESAKMVKNYSTHDLAAILGEDPFASRTVVEINNTMNNNNDDDGYESESESESEQDEKKNDDRKKKVSFAHDISQQQQPREGEDVPPLSLEEEEEEAKIIKAKTEEARWWSSYFVRCGRMGSLKRSRTKTQRGFSEQDQTDLYNAAQGGATQGRVGLGRSSMPKKVGGARWQGTKTKLGSDDDEDGDDDDEKEQETEEDEFGVHGRSGGGIEIVLPTKVKHNGEEKRKEKKKLKKVVSEVLKANGGCMKVKALHKMIVGKEVGGGGVGREEVVAVVDGSSKFKLDGKMVSLVE